MSNNIRLCQTLFWALVDAGDKIDVIDGRLPVFAEREQAEAALAACRNCRDENDQPRKLTAKPVCLRVVPPQEIPRPRKSQGNIPYT